MLNTLIFTANRLESDCSIGRIYDSLQKKLSEKLSHATMFIVFTQCTKIGAVLSHTTDVISGVIQGSVLGPLMFLTFVNELAELL